MALFALAFFGCKSTKTQLRIWMLSMEDPMGFYMNGIGDSCILNTILVDTFLHINV
jgi:hypothetical protein